MDDARLRALSGRHCQAILDEKWMGRTHEVGRVRLVQFHSIFTLIAQIFVAPFGARL